jgi:hypothetical protein
MFSYFLKGLIDGHSAFYCSLNAGFDGTDYALRPDYIHNLILLNDQAFNPFEIYLPNITFS